MKFVADEGLDAPIVQALRDDGHEVYYIKDEHPELPDEDVLKIANERNDILIANDKDFGELFYRLQQIHSGIILIRLSGIKPKEKAAMILAAIKNMEMNYIKPLQL